MTIGKRRRGRAAPKPEQLPDGSPCPAEETVPEETPLPEEAPAAEETAAPKELPPEAATPTEAELAAQRARLDRERAELEAERAEFFRLRMEAAVGEALRQRGLPEGFARWLAAETEEESQARLEEFALHFQQAVASAVAERLRGCGAPREPVRPRGYSREELRNLSRREINAHWEEIQNTLQHE